jgi:hypothetical protein
VSPPMTRKEIDIKDGRWEWCAAGLAVVVGLVIVGVRPSTVLLGAVVLACPLTMLFMHRGHDDGDRHSRRPEVVEPDREPSLGAEDSTARRPR